MTRGSVFPSAANSLTRLFVPVALAVVMMPAAGCDRATPSAAPEASRQPTATPAATALDVPAPEVPPSEHLRFGRLTIDDGLSEGRVWGITQDSRGFMWFTTLAGLDRYDGYDLTIYGEEQGNPNTPGGSAFWTVTEDRDDMLWVGSALGGGLSRLDPDTEQWTRFQHDPADPRSLSSNNVYAVFEDSRGALWIGTDEGGLNRFEGETADGQGRFTHYTHDPDDPRTLGSDFAISVHEDRSGDLWIGAYGGGLSRFDRETETFTRYRHDAEDPGSLSHDFVLPVHEDRSGELWVGTYGGGLNRFDRETETFVRYQHDPDDERSLSGDTVVDILEDQAGTLWIATFDGGLNRYDPTSDTFSAYRHDPFDPYSLGSDTLASLFVDRSGILWIGSAGGGISTLDPRHQGFAHYHRNPADPNGMSHDDVRAVFEDRSGDLWIGTWGGGLNRLDRQTGRFTQYVHDPEDPTSLSDNHVYSVEEDSAGVLWVGVDTRGLNRFDRDTETFARITPDPADPHGLSDGNVASLFEDRTGVLWIGTFSAGVHVFDPQAYDGQARLAHFRHDPEDPSSVGEGMVYAFLEDRAGQLWLGTAGGGLSRFDRETETFARYEHDPEASDSLSDNTVFSIHEDPEGALWIGTSGGLNRRDPQTGQFAHYTTADGLPHNTVYGILADEDGHLWLSTARGLSVFDPVARTFHTYTASDGLQGDVFNPHSAWKSSTGEFLFGGPNGLTAFHPDDIQGNPHVPPVHITSLQLADEPVGVGGDSPLQASILDTESLTLSHEDRIVSFEFAALSFSSPDKNRYRYVLEGFDEDWHEVDSTRRLATYTNLDPGDYTFRVIGSNNDGIWNEEGDSLAITVTPPWWQTTWFRIGFVVLAVGAVAGGYRRRVRSYEDRSRELEVQVAERTEALRSATESADRARAAAESANQAKSVFLANMSHELRTPLNAILGFTRILARDPAISAQQDEMLDVINRSGEHLLGTVDDVLSMAGIEAGQVDLKRDAFDVAQTLTDIGRMVQSRAEAKGLQFALDLDGGLPAYLFGDAGKLRQVLINLLGNAVRYTATGGVWLRVRSEPVADDAAMVVLQLDVEDSGPGIAPERQNEIFEAFARGDAAISDVGGTGLGLTISSHLVELMDGEITVESELGRGSRFRVRIPMPLAEASAVAPDRAPEPEVIGLRAGQPEWRVLVVDDNAGNRLLLTHLLEQTGFVVGEATNGQEAIARYEDWRPDFIWMDMRMPVLDGYEATRRIRALPGGEAVRIGAVTASVFEEQRDEILASGCDALVRKPFPEREIFAVMAELLGVEYTYEPLDGAAPAPPSGADLTAAMLAGLPPDLLGELRETTLALDREGTLEVVGRVEDEAPEVARGLRELVDNYQMGRLRELLAETEVGDDH